MVGVGPAIVKSHNGLYRNAEGEPPAQGGIFQCRWKAQAISEWASIQVQQARSNPPHFISSCTLQIT